MENVYVQLFAGHGMAAFVVKGRAFTTRLPLWGWLPEHQARAGASSPDASGVAGHDVEESPIWRAMRAHGVMARNNVTSGAMSFDLAKHDATRRMLVAYIVLGLGGLAITLPNGIPEGVAATAVLAVGIFSYGALVSLNKLVAPLEPVTYRTGSPCTTLLPDDPALPRIIWSTGFSDFWCQYKVGTEHVIHVRRGLFDTCQFDQGHFIQRFRDHDAARARKRQDPR